MTESREKQVLGWEVGPQRWQHWKHLPSLGGADIHCVPWALMWAGSGSLDQLDSS